jgi:hypothetical protein
MKMKMRIPCLLTIQALLHCSSVVLSLEDPKQNDASNIRAVRKRISENGEITNEVQNDIEIGRQYLESLWDNVEKKNERKLGKGRMRYLESMMSMISMSLPTDPPPTMPTNYNSPVTPSAPIPAPTPTIKGPTLPTREPIPTKAPTKAPTAPTTPAPVELPSIVFSPTTPAPIPPTPPCNLAEKREFLLGLLSRTTETSKLLDLDTPQGKAYSFLREEEPSFVCKPTIMQRYGLTTIYFAMGGTSWSNTDGWLGDKHECAWFGVECNADKFVTGLNLGTCSHNVERITMARFDAEFFAFACTLSYNYCIILCVMLTYS